MKDTNKARFSVGLAVACLAAVWGNPLPLPKEHRLQTAELVKPADTAIDALIAVRTEIARLQAADPAGKIVLQPLPVQGPAAARNAAVNTELRWFRDPKAGVFCAVEPPPPQEYEAGSHLWRTTRRGDKVEYWWYDRMKEKRDAIRASSGEFDVVMLGDSITHWWERGPGRDVLPDLRRTYSVLDLGYGGDKAETLLWRVRNGELDGYRAKVFTIMIGTNNSTNEIPDIAARIGEIVATVRAKQPQAKILLMAIFPRCTPAQGRLRARSVAVSDLIRPLADGEHVFWCDFRPLFLKPDGTGRFDLLHDGTHPGPTGLRVWRDAMLPYFERFTGKRHVPADPVRTPCARRWIACRADLTAPEGQAAVLDFAFRAQAAGYNGIVLDAFDNCAAWQAAEDARLAETAALVKGMGLELTPALRQQADADFKTAVDRVQRQVKPASWFIATNGVAHADRIALRAAVIRQTEMIAQAAPGTEIVVMGTSFAGAGAGLSRDLTIATGRDFAYFAGKGWRQMALFDFDTYPRFYEAAAVALGRYECRDARAGCIYWTARGDYRLMLDAARLAIKGE